MAVNQSWINIVKNSRSAELKTVESYDELNEFFAKQNIQVNKRSHSKQYENGIVCQSIGDVNTSSGSSSTKSSAMVNVLVDGTSVGYHRVTVRTFSARSLDTSDNMIKTGIISVPDYVVIAGVAAACGYSLGYKISQGIAQWLVQQGFDWGYSSTSNEGGHPMPMMIGEVKNNDEVITYIDDNVLERLIVQLNIWGLFDLDPSGETPYEPVIGVNTDYNFVGRFPNIPSKYVDAVENFLNVFLPTNDKPLHYDISSYTDEDNFYTFVGINDQEEMYIVIIPDEAGHNTLNITYRNPKMNGEGAFEYADPAEICQTFNFSGDYERIYPFKIHADGTAESFEYFDGYGVTNFYWKGYGENPETSSGVAYDNFGSYRPIEKITRFDGSIWYGLGAPTDDLSQVQIDPDRVDVRGASLSVRMPGWWANRIKVSCPIMVDAVRDYPVASDMNNMRWFLPLTIPQANIDANISQQNAIAGTGVDTIINPLIDNTPKIGKYIGVDPDPTPDKPPKDTPTTPTLPDGLSSFIDLYEISEGNLNSFADWLWSSNFLDNLVRIVQNPMDGVIGVHAVYATPVVVNSSAHPIVGNLVCNDATASTIKQYASLDCGKVFIKPYFKNINDYVATKIQIYLPFIGIVDVTTSDVMNRYVGIKYNIDFLTGTCTAFIQVQDSLGDNPFTAYTFSGNCAVEIPVTGANYANILRNTMTAGLGIAGAAAGAAEGATADAIGNASMSAANSLITSQIPIQRSGNVGANAGAMGIRIPYVLITRNVAVDADNRRHFEGLPQNINAKLSAMSGYTRVKYINLEGLDCTEEEKADILAKLQGGVFI